jgi:autotransporter-associated beta strand protein
MLSARSAVAANITWANTGITWSAGANWIGGVAPANSTTTDAAAFVGIPNAQPFLSGARSIGSIDLQSSGWIFSGSKLTFGTGGGTTVLGSQGLNSTTNATGIVTFNNGLVLSASQNWTQSLDVVVNGTLEFDGTSATRSLTLNGTGNVTVNGDLDLNSGSGGPARTITITGTGNMTVNGVLKSTINTGTFRSDSTGLTKLTNLGNTYNGGTGISAGILQIVGDGCLGAVPASVSPANISITGSSTLQFASGLGNLTLNGNRGIFINGTASSSRTLTLDTGDNTVSYSGPISDSQTGSIVTGNVTKQGTGTLILSSTNTITGTLNFAAGTLAIGSSSALGNGPLRWGGGTLTATSPLTVPNTSVLTNSSHIGGSQTITFSGPLQFNGTSDRTEAFDQPASAATQVNGGMLISTTAPRQMTISGVGEVDFNSVISQTTGQAGTLRITNTGTVTLGSANTYTGGTILDDVNADVNLGNNASLGTGPLTWNAGTLRSTGAARTIANSVVLNVGDTRLLSGPSDWTFTGPVTVAGGGQRVLSVGATNTATFSGVISTSDGTGFSKAGAGTLVLTGANTYTGGTTVSNGSLIINGTHTGGDSYSIQTGGSIGGTGAITLAGAKNFTLAGNVSPGASPGTLTVNTSGGDGTSTGVTDFQTGGSYTWEINQQEGAAGVNWDVLDLDAVAVTATAGGFTIKITSMSRSTGLRGPMDAGDWNPESGEKRFVIAKSSTHSFTTAMLGGFSIVTTDFGNSNVGGFYMDVGDSGGELDIVYVPEPGTGAIALTVAAAGLLRRTRKPDLPQRH